MEVLGWSYDEWRIVYEAYLGQRADVPESLQHLKRWWFSNCVSPLWFQDATDKKLHNLIRNAVSDDSWLEASYNAWVEYINNLGQRP